MRKSLLNQFCISALIVCASLLIGGCNDELKQKVISLESKAIEDTKKVELLQAQNAKVLGDVKALETEKSFAREKIQSLEAELRQAMAKEGATTEKFLLLQAERQELTKKLAHAEARLEALEAAALRTAKEAAEVARAAAEAANRSNLVVQLGVTMKSGDTKPVTNVQVYLTRTPLLKLLPGEYQYEGEKPNRGGLKTTAAGAWQFGIGKNAVLYGHFVPGIIATIEKDAAFQTTCDFNGRATFDGIPPGEYLVLCCTVLGGGAVLEKSVTVKGKSTLISLGNDDILPDYTK